MCSCVGVDGWGLMSRVCGGRGQRKCWEGIQHPDGLVDEAVLQSAGPCL